MKNAQRIGLFGGSFDPVHNGHIELARAAKNELELDKVIFIPAKHPPHKLNKRLLPAEIRLKMLSAALETCKWSEVSLFEINQKGTTYTYQTVEHFKKLYRGAKLFFIIGSDSLAELPTWKDFENLIAGVQFVTGKRNGVNPGTYSVYEGAVKILKGRIPAVSSSEIRNLAALGKPVKGLVPLAVEKIITSYGLYK